MANEICLNCLLILGKDTNLASKMLEYQSQAASSV